MKKQHIIDHFEAHPQPQTVHEISDQLGATSARAFKQLVKWLAELEQQQYVRLTADGQFHHNQWQGDLREVTGVFRGHERGYGFVTVAEEPQDVFIPRGETGLALSGDHVRVVLLQTADGWQQKAAEGRIVAITEHATKQLVGEFVGYPAERAARTGLIGYVIPKEKNLRHLTCFINADGLRPVDGTICVVSVREYPSVLAPKSLYGVIVQEVGYKDAPGVDILSVLYQLGIPTVFDAATLAEADAVPERVSIAERERRRDFTSDAVITIDGADAKDLDDAICLKRLENGRWELAVHIADVSHYVREGTALDREALERGTSVYVTDRVVPMLPQRLSNGICSLHPNEERLTLSCVMELSPDAEVLSYEIVEGVICSKKRMTYERVNQVLCAEDAAAADEYAPFVPMLQEMSQVHQQLYRKRVRRGAIDFDATEAKIVVDEQGVPQDIVVRERGVAERMIESFMLLANETVAHHIARQQLPFVYRIHEQPDADKMQRFLAFLTNFGVLVRTHHQHISGKTLQNVLEKVAHQPYEAVVSTLLLRSLKQAKYDVQPLGHFGLAARDYTHFTSPIRRYPDLMVHRLLKQYATAMPNKKERVVLIEHLNEVAHQSSLRERRAVDAERETDALKKAEWMQDKIGEQFSGVISSVTRFGFFVELPNTVEGLVHVSTLNDDHYVFVDSQLLLIGSRHKRQFQIGQQVTVTVAAVSVAERTVDFALVRDDLPKRGHIGNRKQRAMEQNKQAKKRRSDKVQAKTKRPKRRKR